MLRQLLEDSSCPWARVLRARGERALETERFLAFAAERGVAREGLEEAMDRFVRERGGRREQTIDPWGFVPNLFRRLIGRPIVRTEELWVLPPGWDRSAP